MGNNLPQSTAVLVGRLRRAARAFDKLAQEDGDRTEKWRAHANVCWQAAGRLQECADILEEREVPDEKSCRRWPVDDSHLQVVPPKKTLAEQWAEEDEEGANRS